MSHSTRRTDAPMAQAADDRPTPEDRTPPGNLLRGLRLTAEDLESLKRQGTVHIENRGGKQIGKLRFRRGTKQVVRYIGGPEAAEQVRKELACWQAAHRQARQLRRLIEEARVVLKNSNERLAPCLEPLGYRFHGLAIRRRRDPPAGDAGPTTSGAPYDECVSTNDPRQPHGGA